MKKIIIALFFFLNCLFCQATPPNLFMEKLFDGRYNANKNVETMIFINNGKFYRGLTVSGDAKVISEIKAAMAKDKDRSSNYTFHQDKDGSYTSMQFTNNGEKIFSGLEINSPDTGFFYIQGIEKAFK